MTESSDERALHRIYAQFGYLRDTHAHDGWVGLFTDDGVFDIDGAPYCGRQALMGFSTNLETALVEQGVTMKHCATDIQVSVTGDDATGRGYFQFYKITNGVPELGALGTYTDRFRRIGAEWKIAERVGRADTTTGLS